jgi:hypothetical protein
MLGSAGFVQGTSDPKASATLLPLRQWRDITEANSAGNQFVMFAATSQIELSATPTKRATWSWPGWTATYQWLPMTGLILDFGTTSAPGLHSYHGANSYSWTTFDNDQDVAGNNCAGNYNNAPWWYGACWSGSMWGGNGNAYQNAMFWTSSGNDFHNYGAYYVR